jgi:hypothetical protein
MHIYPETTLLRAAGEARFSCSDSTAVFHLAGPGALSSNGIYRAPQRILADDQALVTGTSDDGRTAQATVYLKAD